MDRQNMNCFWEFNTLTLFEDLFADYCGVSTNVLNAHLVQILELSSFHSPWILINESWVGFEYEMSKLASLPLLTEYSTISLKIY